MFFYTLDASTVFVQVMSDDDSRFVNHTGQEEPYCYSITGLASSRNFSVEINAENGAGWGEIASGFEVTEVSRKHYGKMIFFSKMLDIIIVHVDIDCNYVYRTSLHLSTDSAKSSVFQVLCLRRMLQ